MIVIVSVVYGMQSGGKHKPIEQETSTEATTEAPETELEKEVSVDGISITGLSPMDLRPAPFLSQNATAGVKAHEQTAAWRRG